MPNVRKRLVAIASFILLTLVLWWGSHREAPLKTDNSASRKTKTHGPESAATSESPGKIRTKAATREIAGPRATHAPERLKEFILPEVAIDGLTLSEALKKLTGVYEETCRKTGETPLRLTFDIPSGKVKKLQLRLSSRNFNASVQLLATFAGMSVSRDKLQYRFMPFANERKPIKVVSQVAPDFAHTLSWQTSQETGEHSPFEINLPKQSITELIRASGLDLDPSTRLSLSSSGSLNLETTSTADAALVSALARNLSEGRPIQQKHEAKIVELPANADWTPPDLAQLTNAELQSLMRGIAEKQGAELMTLPSVTNRSGQDGTIEIVRDFISPKDGSETEFETRQVGKVMHVRGDTLGFGHNLTFDYTDTTGGIDPATGKPRFEKRTDLAESGFSSDGGTQFAIQTRPDGTKTIMLITSTLIDATGRPVHGGE